MIWSHKMKKAARYIILVIFCLNLAAPCALCEEAKPAREFTLSLEDAIIIAFKNNKDIQIQEEEIMASRANIVGARSQFLPDLNLNTGYTRSGAILAVPLKAKKDPGIFMGYKNANSVDVSLSESVYNGGASIANFNQAKLDLQVQQETLRARKLDTEFEAKRLYYGLLLAYETKRITEELVGNAQDHYEDVKHKFEQGTSSRFDLLQSKVQVSLLIPELVKAKNAIDLIMADLKKLLGLKMQDLITLRDDHLEYSLMEIKENEFLKEAYLDKPEMTLKSLGIDIGRWSIEMAKSGWRPQLNADLDYSYKSNDLSDMFNNRHNNWYAGVSLTIPIFDGFSTKAKVDAARARYAQANLAKENLVDQIAVDIRQGCLDLGQAEAIINSQKDNIEEAKEALGISIISYDNGVGTNLDVLDSQVSLAQVEQNLSQGIYDYLMAGAFLDRTMGKSFLREAKNEEKK
jgi:outer membrane protein TolC